MKTLISLVIVTLASLPSCEKSLDRSYKSATDKSGEEKVKQDEAIHAQELVKEVLGLRDLNAMASNAGVDYPVLLERALRKEKDAVAKLLWLAGNANLDTASSEGYSWSMVRAARLIGDQDVSDAAHSLDSKSREALRMSFLFEYGFHSDSKTAVADFKKDFPLLWATTGAEAESAQWYSSWINSDEGQIFHTELYLKPSEIVYLEIPSTVAIEVGFVVEKGYEISKERAFIYMGIESKPRDLGASTGSWKLFDPEDGVVRLRFENGSSTITKIAVYTQAK